MAFYYSYKTAGGSCHVPDDNSGSLRTTPLKLNGVSQSGYQSYFMQQRTTIPSFNEISNGDDVFFWREGVENSDYNVDLLGIKTLSECYTVCQLTTSGNCWILR